ncbi:MAG: ABC transporter ATP-binding protein [Alcaligenaceae bacterium]|nr:ABC transporter ATP-binding protein [Alcaligenaceae bacterium]
MNPENALLEVNDITVQFGGLVAVDDVTFSVNNGELLGLIGPNGAGKTTVMRSITGVVKPTSGRVTLNGHDISNLATHQRIRRGLSLSQQLVRPFREISILDNVALAAGNTHTISPLKALMHVSAQAERKTAMHMLERVGIAHLANQMPGIQPLGVLKRMEMARALALEPSLLLLDEPLAGLNSNEARTLADTIAEINQQGVTIILIEHNLTEVLRICQRLVVLDNGRKIASGLPREVMQQPNVRAAYLGTEQSSAQPTQTGDAYHA